MNIKTNKTIIVTIIISNLNISIANEYVVKKNDTLSSILYQHNLLPIYGKNGSLARTLKLNPKSKMRSDGNIIFPKTKIILANTVVLEKVKLDDELQLTQPTKSEKELNEVPVISSKNPVIEQPINDRKPSDDFEQKFYWIVAPTLSWKNLSSTDDNNDRISKINALSNMNYGLSLTYGMHFEENIDVYSKIALEYVNFIEDNSIFLDKKNFLINRFNVGASYKRNWLLEFGMNDEFFLTSPAISRIEIKKVALPEIKSGYQNDFYQYRNAKLAYLVSGSAILPRSTPGVDSKLSFGLGAELEAKLKNQSFVIGYDVKLLKATGNPTDNHNIYWNYLWKSL